MDHALERHAAVHTPHVRRVETLQPLVWLQLPPTRHSATGMSINRVF